LTLLGRYSLSSDLRLSPLVAATVRSADADPGSSDDVDPDVSSAYARQRPRSIDVGVYLSHRPATDAVFRYGLVSRLTPDLDGIDAADLSGRWRVLPGTGIVPYITLNSTVSFRPVSQVRDRSYVRTMVGPSLVFWRWLERDHRLTVALGAAYYHDFPVTPQPDSGLSGVLTVSYDFTWGRGLDDLSPADRPFQGRLEEPVDRPYRSARAKDPYWEEPP
jgi:hypothetical protein